MSSYVPDRNVFCEDFSNCPGFLERYLAYMKDNQGKRPRTLAEAVLTLREFCQYVHYRTVLHEIPPTADAHKGMGISNMNLAELVMPQADFEDYISFLENVAGNVSGTLKKKLSIIRTFYSYLCMIQEETGVQFRYGNPAAAVHSPSVSAASPPVLSMNQIQQMLDAVPDETAYRDRALLLLMATTGITLSELSSLEKDDIEDDTWVLVHGSNGDRYLYLTPHCRKALRMHLLDEAERCRSDIGSKYIFPSGKGSDLPLTPRTIRNVVIKAAALARLQNLDITPKVLRDTVADVLYKAAESHEQSNVSAYLGYRISYPKRAIAINRKVQTDPVMERIVDQSALSSLCGTKMRTKGGDSDVNKDLRTDGPEE